MCTLLSGICTYTFVRRIVMMYYFILLAKLVSLHWVATLMKTLIQWLK